jgi:hypothetical protein
MSPGTAGRSRWTPRLLATEAGLTSRCVSDDFARRAEAALGAQLEGQPLPFLSMAHESLPRRFD